MDPEFVILSNIGMGVGVADLGALKKNDHDNNMSSTEEKHNQV